MNDAMTWDLTSYFPAFDGPEMKRFKRELQDDIAALNARAADLPPLDDTTLSDWEEIFLAYEELIARLSHLGSYIGCLTSADANDEAYAREDAALALTRAAATKLEVELLRAVKEADDPLFTRFVEREELETGRYYLERMRQEARRSMSTAEEVLAADLGVDGIHAWGRLYDTLSGKLEFDVEYPDGRSEHRPMAQRRALMEDPDRRVRRAAFAGGNAAWQQYEDVAAAALNSISGTRLTLNRHRRVDHFLDIALFQAGIGRKTLDAMFEAIFSQIELPRRILRLKAQSMGTDGVAWYDLGAPLPLAEREALSWEAGKRLVESAFGKAYPALGDFFRHAIGRRWVESEPRPGKRPGAFCTSSLLTREARVYMTYNDTMGDAHTLAHELGHAFHGYLMRDLRPFARRYPMTLAESASTFGEMLLTEGILADPGISLPQKAAVLDMEAGHAAIFLLDIPVRYEFERLFHEERMEGEVSVSRIRELMVLTQRRLFGEVLEEGGEDPYFWASKLHFYITGVTFYNFPYTFGFLLSRGLFALFQQQGADFLPRYEEFLRLTGSDTAENVARRTIGRDLETPDFWIDAIATLEEPLARLEEILPRVLPASTPHQGGAS